jgi:hypothetical protein
MIHIPIRPPPKKTRSRKQTPEDASTSETQRLVHEIVNQLSVMNLCCFKFRAAQAYLPPSSLADIDRMENAVTEIAALLGNIAKSKTPKPLDSPLPDPRQSEPPQVQAQPSKVYHLFKPTRLQR